HCSDLSDADGGELFEDSAKSVSKLIKERYPKTGTVKLEPDSDMSLSDIFSSDLRAALNSVGVKLVSSGTADLIVRIDLQRKQIQLKQRLLSTSLQLLLATTEGWLAKRGTESLG